MLMISEVLTITRHYNKFPFLIFTNENFRFDIYLFIYILLQIKCNKIKLVKEEKMVLKDITNFAKLWIYIFLRYFK